MKKENVKKSVFKLLPPKEEEKLLYDVAKKAENMQMALLKSYRKKFPNLREKYYSE